MKMQKYRCIICGYVYDPAEGDPDNDIPAGTPFEDLPDDWVCPVCGASKEDFEPVEEWTPLWGSLRNFFGDGVNPAN